MNNNRMEIKERKADLLSRGVGFLIVAIISLVIALLPLISKLASMSPLPFYLVGGALFIIFITLFIILIYREFNPQNALFLTSSGFIDKKNVGDEIVVQWTNVSSVKLLARKNVSYLGITLENSDIIIAKMKKSLADEMRENIEENLPSILISQENVRISVNELKEIFIKYIREARVVENGAPSKPKNNPFSSEDVLRAFGKLPVEEDNKNEIIESNDVPVNIADDATITPQEENTTKMIVSENLYEQPITAPERIEPTQESTQTSLEIPEEASTPANSFDSFYEKLQIKVTENAPSSIAIEQASETEAIQNVIAETNDESEKSIEPIDASSEDMPDEIKEILNRAKSSKISELGKMLNEDTPFSYANPSKNNDSTEGFETSDDESNIQTFESDSESLQAHILNSNNSETDYKITPEIGIIDAEVREENANNGDEFEIILPQNLFEESHNKKREPEITFESIISDESESSSSRLHDDKTDTKEFYPELIQINDTSFNEKKNDDDDGFIIPDLIEYK